MKIDPKLYEKDKLYGAVTIGSRGQVVIPAQARKDLSLKPGDQLLVMGKLGKTLGLMKAEDLQEIIALIMEQVRGQEDEQEIKRHIARVFAKTGYKLFN